MRDKTSAEVGMGIGVSAASIQRYARSGSIPFDQTPGGHRRFNIDEVRDALDSGAAVRLRRARVVVLTALQSEYDAVCEELENTIDRTLPNGTIYTEGTLEGESVEWRVAVAEIGEGNLGATAEASAAIDQYKPDLVMFVGVAGGLKSDVPQGSVVVATKVYQYQSGKDAADLLTRPNTFPTDHALLQLARKVKRGKWDWEGEQPIVELKPIAAGELVLTNSRSATAELIRTRFNDAAAVDMESAGMYQAAHRARGVAALAIRGISDMLDDKSSENDADWQPRAARNAARFMVALLQAADEHQLTSPADGDGDADDSELEELLGRLPATVTDCIRDGPDAAGHIDWVRTLADTEIDSSQRLADVRKTYGGSAMPNPQWILALAEFASAHALPAQAGELFSQHATESSRPARSLARAGMEALARNDTDAAITHFRSAEAAALDPAESVFPRMLRLTAAEQYADALAAANELDAADSIGQIIRARLMGAEGKVREARDLVTRLVRDHPRASPALLLEAAERILQAHLTLEPEEGEHEHLQLAYELAISARDQRRTWGGDSPAAAAIAARTAGLTDNPRDVLSLALAAPDGQATREEADYSPLRQMACYAAMQLAEYTLARDLSRNLDDRVESDLIGVALLEAEGADAPELVPALRRIATNADADPSQISRALLQLARHGEMDSEALERLRSEQPDFAEMVLARIETRDGNLAGARRRIAGVVSPMALDMMAEISVAEGRLDDVLVRYRERFNATNNPAYLMEAAEHMLRAKRFEEAAQLAEEGLAAAGISDALQLKLCSIAVEAFARQQDWTKVERYSKRALTDDQSDAGVGWALVFALHNQRRLPEALAAMIEHRLLPRSPDEATCALVLWRQHTNHAEAIDASIHIAREFPDSEEVIGTALMCSLDLSARMPQEAKPDPAVSSALAELSEVFFDAWPDSTIVSRFPAGTPEEIIEGISAAVRRGAPSDEQIALSKEVAVGRMPLGVLAASANKPLLEIIVSAAAGSPLISTLDTNLAGLEAADAEKALGEEVVCDVHTVAVLAEIPDHEASLRREFLRLRTPMHVLDDALLANDQLQRRSTGTLTWDEKAGSIRLVEIEQEEADAFAAKAKSALKVARSVVAEVVRTSDAFDAPGLGVVMAPIELARQRGIAVWSDDPGLRRLARGEGIPSFGTMALLDVLGKRGTFSAARIGQLKGSLLRGRFDIVTSTECVLDYLAEHDFQFPAASILARRTTWLDPQRGLAVLHASLEAESGVQPEHRCNIIASAAFGAGSLGENPAQSDIVTAIGISSLLRSDDQVTAFPIVLKALRIVTEALDLADPLQALIKQLRETMSSDGAAPAVIARMILYIAGAADKRDREQVAKIVVKE